MLTSLYVKNLALIDEAEVSFGSGLNILTGETGAGKSILLGSINLALGQKFSKDMMREGADSALVELVFQVETAEQTEQLKALEIEPEDGQLIFSRKIRNGRTMNRINGEACTVAQFREAASLLLEIHGQHEHQTLLQRGKQLELVDAYAGENVAALRAQTAEAYRIYQKLQEELAGYRLNEAEREREISYLQFAIDEIDAAALTKGEEEQLEKQYRLMANSRKIAEGMNLAYQFTGSDAGAGEQISRAIRELNAVSEYDEEIAGMEQTLIDAESVLEDFNRAVSSYLDAFTFSEEEFRQTEERLDLIRSLQTKYGRTIADVLAYREEQAARLDTLLHFSEKKAEREQALAKQEKELASVSAQLTAARKKAAEDFSEELRAALLELNFLSNEFAIQFAASEHYGANGTDLVTWMISTNPGEPLRPLSDVASGGELSRIMLAIRTIMAERGGRGTLIFDEIDTGISGRTAQMVSEKMARIASHHQVICITHLAQIAAMADQHFLIEKQAEAGVTRTQIRELDAGDSVRELARILGGAAITDAAMENAREMKRLAAEYREK
ncbi:MAG: DNA repair protein RecN [Eubacterium sp.]|nr:DNA repair protein RecN [Eubacterium sp.]